MQDNNQKETMSNDDVVVPTTDTPVSATETVIGTQPTVESSELPEVVNNETEVTAVSPTPKKNGYIWAVVVIAVIGLGLTFVLEKEGRISTGLFSGVIDGMKSNSPVAKVNGVDISRKDYDSSLKQLLQIAATQGVDTTDPNLTAQYKTQAIDTLVNGELLRQEAIASGIEVTKEDVDARFEQIKEGIGGQELLDQKMTEFGITAETLRRDIENEILIQGLFDTVIDAEKIQVTDAEADAYYLKLGGEEAGLPPYAEVKTQIEEQIKLDKQQEQIAAYLESTKSDADIEVLI